MALITVAILLIYTLFLAGKDADSYLLKDKSATGTLTTQRINRWHRDGVALAAMFAVVLAYSVDNWYVLIQAVLLRLSVFDLAFNYWSGLSITYLGGTADTDKLFVKIFGINGAVVKSIIFFLILLVFTSYLVWIKN